MRARGWPSKSIASTEQQLVTTGLARAQADLSGAKAAYKTAMEAGDYDKAADAQALMARASAMILAAESAGAEAGQRAEELKRQPQQDRQQPVHPMLRGLPATVPGREGMVQAASRGIH